jgi:hypothetical protein
MPASLTRRSTGIVEPDDRWWFADEPRLWLERAVGLVR